MRAFIFGAGASVHAGYPLATKLWDSMAGWVKATFSPDSDLGWAVDTMYEEFDLSKSFELVLTDLDDRIEPFLLERPKTPEGIREKVMLVQLRDRTQTIIPLYFNSLRARSADLYSTFACEVLEPGDLVITFNYDLALDREMKKSGKWSAGDGYGFEVDGPLLGISPCKLFKLHGSTNWRGEHFQGRMGFFAGNPFEMSLGRRPILDASELEFLGYPGAVDPMAHAGRTRTESIIMPTANKKFFTQTSFGREWEDFWNALWLEAKAQLRLSREIYVVGYSIPEFDSRARLLLQDGIRHESAVRVCCHSGTDSVVSALRELTHVANPDVQGTKPTTFEGWLPTMI